MSNEQMISELYRQREALYNGQVNQEDLMLFGLTIDSPEIQSAVEPTKECVIIINTMAETKEAYERVINNIIPISLGSLPSKFITPTEFKIGESYSPVIKIEEPTSNENNHQKMLELEAA